MTKEIANPAAFELGRGIPFQGHRKPEVMLYPFADWTQNLGGAQQALVRLDLLQEQCNPQTWPLVMGLTEELAHTGARPLPWDVSPFLRGGPALSNRVPEPIIYHDRGRGVLMVAIPWLRARQWLSGKV